MSELFIFSPFQIYNFAISARIRGFFFFILRSFIFCKFTTLISKEVSFLPLPSSEYYPLHQVHLFFFYSFLSFPFFFKPLHSAFGFKRKRRRNGKRRMTRRENKQMGRGAKQERRGRGGRGGRRGGEKEDK